jgi:hypothetical protein
MAAEANDEAPILVRNDPIMYRFLQNQKDKFKITIDITSDKKIYAKYEICLFMYDMKSREREDCPSLEKDYHSHKKGQGCSYVGFINKELTDDVHNAFFYKDNTTTWFLDYNIIDPTIKIEEITKENYSTPFIMNKNAENEVKKISYAKGNMISHVKSIFGEDEVIKTFEGTLDGEHVVISNGDKPIFTLSELFFNYYYTEKHNIISRVLNKFLIIALLNNENKFTYKNGPDEKIMAIRNFDIEVNSVDYINDHTEKYLTNRENINECIKNILTCLKNDSIGTYVSTHLLAEPEERKKNFNKMDKKISTIQEELFSIFKHRLSFDSNKKLIEAREIVKKGYIPSNTKIFTEESQKLNDKKQAYLTKKLELDEHFQKLLELATIISDQLITKTNERQELAERATQSVLNKFDTEIEEHESLNAKIIENQEQMKRKRNEEEARLKEEEARLKQEYEQMSPDNKKKKREEQMARLIELKIFKSPEEKEMIKRKRKEEENHEKMQSQLRQELLKREK